MTLDDVARILEGGLLRSSRNLPQVFSDWDTLDTELCETHESQLNYMLSKVPTILAEYPDRENVVRLACSNIHSIITEFDKRSLVEDDNWDIIVNLIDD